MLYFLPNYALRGFILARMLYFKSYVNSSRGWNLSNPDMTAIITLSDSRCVARIFVRGEHQTKFPVRSKEFRFEAVKFSKNLLNEDFLKSLKIYIKIAHNFRKFSQIFQEKFIKILTKFKKFSNCFVKM